MDAGRFERLEKPGCEPERNHVFDPWLAAVTGLEPKRPGISQRLTVEICEQRRGGLVVGDVSARIDIAITDPMLERNSPLPAGRPRRRSRERQMIAPELARHGECPVAWQPLRPILETRLERLLDQKSAKARAIDEQVA